MSNNSNNSSTNTLGLLGVLFVGLKLGGIINWSWWYVTMPFWGGLALLAITVLIVFIVTMVVETKR
jgi:hypothetical protein